MAGMESAQSAMAKSLVAAAQSTMARCLSAAAAAAAKELGKEGEEGMVVVVGGGRRVVWWSFGERFFLRGSAWVLGSVVARGLGMALAYNVSESCCCRVLEVRMALNCWWRIYRTILS